MTADISPVIAAVEQAMCGHVHGPQWEPPTPVPDATDPRNCVAACYACQRSAVEVAKAAMDAARPIILREAADLLRKTALVCEDHLISGSTNAATLLLNWADKQTSTDDRSK